MENRNRVLVVPVCKTSEINYKKAVDIIKKYPNYRMVWDDSKYGTSEVGDKVIFIDNKTKEVLLSGVIKNIYEKKSVFNIASSWHILWDKWSGYSKENNVLFIDHDKEFMNKPHMKQWVTKTGRVHGTTLRHGV